MIAVSGLIHGVHDLSAAVWVGGLTILLFVVLPSFSQRGDATLLMDLQKRLVKLLRPVIVLVVLTGVLSLPGISGDEGRKGVPQAYRGILAIKLLLTAAMIGVSVRRQWWLHKYAYARPRQGMVLLVINTSLGWITILLSGVLSVLGDVG